MPAKKKDDGFLILAGLAVGAFLLYRYSQTSGNAVATGTVTDTGVPDNNLTTVAPATPTPPYVAPTSVTSPSALANQITNPIPLGNIGATVANAITQATPSANPATVAQVTQQTQQILSSSGTDTITPVQVAQAVNTATAQVTGTPSTVHPATLTPTVVTQPYTPTTPTQTVAAPTGGTTSFSFDLLKAV